MELYYILGIFLVVATTAEALKLRRKHKTSTLPALSKTAHMIPHALTMLIMVAHASEITRVVTHIEPMQVTISAILFGAWFLSTKRSAEEI